VSVTTSGGQHGGFVGTVIRGKVRNETQTGMEAALRAGKAKLETR
jgi:hypothetical protein